MKLLLFLLVMAVPTLAAFDGPYVPTETEHCMALNIYHEARSENMAGKFAVADVVLNRVNDRRYPDTVCGVIYQAELSEWWLERGREVPVKGRCQFSWYCDGIKDDPMETDAWAESLIIAYQILNNDLYRGLTEGSTHYHANYVKPPWAPSFHFVGHIGSHIFYRAD
jgi:spore germination cell wall hydrolase CwlJ-like protein